MRRAIKSEMEAAVYHRMPQVSVHQLGAFAECPARYKWDREYPKEQTDAMWWGEVVHTAVLEPDRFASEYKIVGINRTSKKAWAELEDENPEHELLTEKEGQEALAMAQAIRLHPAAGKLLGRGYDENPVENMFFWECEETGVKCRARMDFITDCGIIADVKTCGSAAADNFSKGAYNFRYHVQAAFYLWGAQKCGIEVDSFVFIAVEKEAPYLVAAYAADPAMLELGRKTFREELARFAQCDRENHWPGYSDGIQSLSLPAYAK